MTTAFLLGLLFYFSVKTEIVQFGNGSFYSAFVYSYCFVFEGNGVCDACFIKSGLNAFYAAFAVNAGYV